MVLLTNYLVLISLINAVSSIRLSIDNYMKSSNISSISKALQAIQDVRAESGQTLPATVYVDQDIYECVTIGSMDYRRSHLQLSSYCLCKNSVSDNNRQLFRCT